MPDTNGYAILHVNFQPTDKAAYNCQRLLSQYPFIKNAPNPQIFFFRYDDNFYEQEN